MVTGACQAALVEGSWSGSGPAVVLLHGQPGSGLDWAAVTPHLDGLRLFAPTRPGYDGSRPLDFAGNARALVDRLDAAGVQRSVVVGHSLGGGIALQLALHAPDRIAALCLLGSVGSPLAVTRLDRVMAAPGARAVSAAFMRATGAAMARVVAAAAGSRLDPRQRATLRLALAEWARSGAWTSYAAEQAMFVRDAPALADRLGEVRAPVVVGIGTRDRTVPARVGLDLAARLPNAEVHELDAGHLLPLEVPTQVASAIKAAVGRAAL